MLSSIGLIIDLIGVVLLFIWPPVMPFPRIESYSVIRPTKEQLDIERKQNIMAKIGLAVLFVGFIFQLIGTLS